MSDLEQARLVLRMAERDLRAVVAMGGDESFADEIVGFHIQQAIEKSLKAWIAALGEPYPFTHDLGRLLGTLERLGQDVEPFWALTLYTDFAVALRYDAVSSEEQRGAVDRPSAIAEAQALLDRVRHVVEDEPGDR